MGVYHYLSVTAADPGPADPARFAALLDDLMDGGMTAGPVFVLSGEAGPHPGALAIGTGLAPQWLRGEPPPAAVTGDGMNVVVRYAGQDRAAIRSAVLGAPFGRSDVCAYFHLTSPGDDRDPPGMACDGAVFSTLRAMTFGREESLILSAEGVLYDYDPDDPDDLFTGGGARAAAAYPVDKAAGYVTASARWFVSVEGGYGWQLAGPVITTCARHFGAGHFLGYHAT